VADRPYDAPAAWAAGPGPYYDRLAAWLVGLARPDQLAGKRALDLGTGTGAVARVLSAAGARPIGADLSLPMLLHDRESRPPAVCLDALALPLSAGTVDVVAAGFSLTHVPDPARAVAECARVLVPGGVLLASAFTRRFPHPAQAAVEDVLTVAGWKPPPWYVDFKNGPDAALSDPLRLLDLAAGFSSARVVAERVPTGVSTPAALVGWRLGMPSCTTFLAELTPERRAQVYRAALDAVTGSTEPLRPEVAALVAER
jgi:SAM-dependent methyltransferase